MVENLLSGYLAGTMHQLVGLLLQPVIALLLILVGLVIGDSGIAIGERVTNFRAWRALPLSEVERRARKRIERADFSARLGPILGLMGTLIPLGPGLAALGNGDVKILATSIQVAFDTTVLGLLIGLVGFVLGRLRRRWYNALLDVGDEQIENLLKHESHHLANSHSSNNQE